MNDDPARYSLSKRLFQRVMVLPLLTECFAGLTHSEATIFAAHRFSVPELGTSGHDPQNLRKILAQLRRRSYDLISIGELFRRLRIGESLDRAVAFTIDDGYYDIQIVAPIFADFDCPVTVFAITDFLDGKIWLWWDKIAYIFMETKRTEISAALGRERFHFRLQSKFSDEGWHALVNRCYSASEEDRLACIDELSATAEVELPSHPPERYRALSWEEARELERLNISFGPHTLTHPVLSSISADQSSREITGSWERLREKVSRPVPIFCYPGGEYKDFGEREIATMSRIGLWGAVTGEPGNICSAYFRQPTEQWYQVPRCLYRDTLHSVLQSISGIERLKMQLRAKLAN